MKSNALKQLPPPLARLVQIGLKKEGYYQGTTRGIPGPKTQAAFDRYLADLEGRPVRSTTLQKKIIRLAENEVGVREHPKDSNRGERVEDYQETTWHKGTGWPWCAAFICWLFKKAGVPDGLRPQTPGAWDFENWARKKKDFVELVKPASKDYVEEGDVVIFKFSHIGLAVDGEEDGLVKTIEGNTDAAGSREGGGVYRKVRKKSQIRSIIRLK